MAATEGRISDFRITEGYVSALRDLAKEISRKARGTWAYL